MRVWGITCTLAGLWLLLPAMVTLAGYGYYYQLSNDKDMNSMAGDG